MEQTQVKGGVAKCIFAGLCRGEKQSAATFVKCCGQDEALPGPSTPFLLYWIWGKVRGFICAEFDAYLTSPFPCLTSSHTYH